MEDWLWAVGIIVLSILIAILLSKRHWVHKKKKQPIKHYTKSRDKLSGIETVEDLPDSAKAVIVLVVLTLVGFAVYFIYRLVKWFFSKGILDIINTASVSTSNIDTVMSGFGLPSGTGFIVILAPLIMFSILMFGGRSMRRHAVLLFILTIPILFVLGVPFNVILMIGIVAFPIVIFRWVSRSSRLD